MNLKKIRRAFTPERILECLKQNTRCLIMGDQDLINLLFGEHTVFVYERVYNLDERTCRHYRQKEPFDLKTVEDTTAVIHYNGKYKPWLEGHKGEPNRFYPEISPKGSAPTKVIRGILKSVYQITQLTAPQKIAAAGALIFSAVCVLLFFSGTRACRSPFRACGAADMAGSAERV